MGKVIGVFVTICVFFGFSILSITAIGIIGGLLRDNVVKPFHQRYIVQPLYVDDPRCCR